MLRCLEVRPAHAHRSDIRTPTRSRPPALPPVKDDPSAPAFPPAKRPYSGPATTPMWLRRASLIARDLASFDMARLDFLLATRTTLALFLPLLAAHLTGWNDLVWLALGAYLLCIGDCVEDGDQDQPMRLVVGLMLGSLAFASGVLAGGHLGSALAGMVAWSLVCGLMGLWGPTYAAMSLPVVWAYVELGLPAQWHDPGEAGLMAALFAGGGLLALALTLLFGLIDPLRKQRRLVAACYQTLADFTAGDGTAGLVSRETRVRSAIAQARTSVARARVSGRLAREKRARLFRLAEAADRLFSLVSLLKETEGGAAAGFRPGFLAMARRIATGTAAPLVPVQAGGGSASGRILADELAATASLLDAPSLPAEAPPLDPGEALPSGLVRLRENLTFDSVALRHALRYAAVMSGAVLIFWVFPKPFGFWVPLTVTVVLKPFAGMTLARAVQRVVGTVGGIALGMALMPVLTTIALKFAFVLVAFFLMMSVLPFNYSLAIFFLSAGIIPFEHALNPALHADVAGLRLLATLIGATLALVGGHLLWPDFERRAVPLLVRQTCRSMADYARAVLANETGAVPGAHRRTGLEVTNLQTSLQRAMSEIGGDGAMLMRQEQASAALQRLFVSLNAARLGAPLALPRDFPQAFSGALAQPERGGAARCRDLLDQAPPVAPVAVSLCDALAWLEASVAPVAPGQDESTPPAAAQPVAKQA